tara:strand:+ start:1320 stop:1733 length:414 start_codon:yes stop_codon:yes gene_type:complete
LRNYKQFIIFICTGGLAALVNIFSRVILSNYLAFELSIVIAYFFAIITAYFLAKIFVFKNKKVKVYRSFAFFFLVNIFAIFQTWMVTILFRNYIFEFINIDSNRDLFAHIIGVCVPVFSSYYGHKYITFNNNWKIKN